MGFRVRFPRSTCIQRCCQKNRALRHGLGDGLICIIGTIAQKFSKIKNYESVIGWSANVTRLWQLMCLPRESMARRGSADFPVDTLPHAGRAQGWGSSDAPDPRRDTPFLATLGAMRQALLALPARGRVGAVGWERWCDRGSASGLSLSRAEPGQVVRGHLAAISDFDIKHPGHAEAILEHAVEWRPAGWG